MVGIDPVFTREKVSVRAADYIGSATPAAPSISPIFADLHGLPPILIQAGSHEILLDDSIRLARLAAIDDVDTTLDVTPGCRTASKRSLRSSTRATPPWLELPPSLIGT